MQARGRLWDGSHCCRQAHLTLVQFAPASLLCCTGKQLERQRAAVLPDAVTERTAAAKQPFRATAVGPSCDASACKPHSMHVPPIFSQCCSAGLAVGVELLQLPWTVAAVMLAGSKDYYQQQTQQLCAAFSDQFDLELHSPCSNMVWQEREVPRPFGKVFQHDVEQCRQVSSSCACLRQRFVHVSLPSTAPRLHMQPPSASTIFVHWHPAHVTNCA